MRETLAWGFWEPSGQGWSQLAELATALVLCSLIGLEREFKQKSAGLRTHTLVGLGAALFVLVSKYGFTDVLQAGYVTLDPSRLASQIVSGIGFIGGGLIFVRRDMVRGLTTAAVVWVSVAVGCACAAGLPLLAAFVTGAHFLVVYAYTPLVRFLKRSRPESSVVRVAYREGEGALRRILALATESGYAVEGAHTERRAADEDRADEDGRAGILVRAAQVIDLELRLVGPGTVNDLLTKLAEEPAVLAVHTGDADDTSE
jgi:putative Mg2+ transporter-C (MgtC) family protein